MTYNRSRFEKILNEDGSVKEIFIAVRIDAAEGQWEQGYWLTDAERDAVVADESALVPIVDKVAIQGETALHNYRMQPAPEPFVPPV